MENNFIEGEHKTLKFWEEIGLLGKIKEKNKQGKPWSFLDGPITANNPMGVHHAWGRTLKDLFQRLKAMQGYNQRLQNGFDCQGLWVEVEVEKDLGFKSKKDIEIYGIEKFVNKCKERVHKYSKIQTEQSIRLGMLRDWGNWQTEFDEKGEWIKQSHSYYTLSDENNYAIWHFLKVCHEKKLLYKGHDVVAWCPRCGTAISQHEILTEEYKEITHQAVYLRLPVIGQAKTYFLAWTTTPWTLPANVFLSVHPELTYAKVVDPQGDIYILLKDKAYLIEGGRIVEEFSGQVMTGWKYQGVFDDLPASKDSFQGYEHQVYLWDEITQEDGTGVVHSAPGCGQEDFKLAKQYQLPVINPTDNESKYVEGFGELSGKFVGSEQVREWIFNSLQAKGLVYKIENYKHRYPTCWRCKSELIFRLVDEWYISMDKLREPLMKAVEKINWIPGFCKERELDWLKNMHDWLISKKRYWGLALPVFECECGHFEVIGSKEELQKRAIEGWQDFDGHSPHRPWVDTVKIKCSKCKKIVSRILDVGSPWLDAGIVPFSTIPDKKWFPADLVCEGFPGQFKNWFYVLLVMSQVLENESPFKNLLGFANVVDEKGEEMHKSKGNAIWFDEGVEKAGADVMRWMYTTANPANNLRFGYNVAKETERKILTLTNCVKFFETYSEKEGITNYELRIKKLQNILDKWILSRLNNLIKEATENLEGFNPSKASLAIENFWINDLSLWFVRRSRKRFQNPESSEDKEQAESTFYFVLLATCKLLAPFMPFLSEEIYQKLKTNAMPESIHLCEWPKADKKLIDENLEQEVVSTRNLVEEALSLRAELKIGVRQPVASITVPAFKITGISAGSAMIFKEEVNVKEIFVSEDLKELKIDTTMSDELKEEGLVREIVRQIQDLRKKAGLTPADRVDVCYIGSVEVEAILVKNEKQILETTKSQKLIKANSQMADYLATKETKIENGSLFLGIIKV